MDDFFIAEEERVIAPEFIMGDNEIETSLRPHTLDEYVGQEKAKENIKADFDFICYMELYVV